MSAIARVLLKDLVTICGGGTPRRSNQAYFDGDIPWVTPKDMKTSELRDSLIRITPNAVRESAAKLVPSNSVLIVIRSGVLKHSLPIAINRVPVALNQDMKALSPGARLIPEYLANYLRARTPELLKSVRATTADNLPLDKLKHLEIPVPTLTEQRRVATILDTALGLVAKRERTIRHLDDLKRSIFDALCRSPHMNDWRDSALVELCASPEDIRCGPFGTQLHRREFTEFGVPLWGIKHVNRGFREPTSEFVSSKTAERLRDYSIRPLDIVMTRKGTVGNCAIYPAQLPEGIMHSDLLRIRTDPKRVNPVFLSYQLQLSPAVAMQLSALSGGAVMGGINVSRLKQLHVVIPAMPIQVEFEKQVEATESQRLKLIVSMNILGELVASLRQRLFSASA